MAYTGDKKREYSREWVARRRREYFKDKTCLLCGSIDDLEIHHRDPSNKVSNSIWSWRIDRRDVELLKCDILCGDCHKVETKKYLSRPMVHGTWTVWKRGCRCGQCSRFHVDAKRAQRLRKKIREGSVQAGTVGCEPTGLGSTSQPSPQETWSAT